MNNLDHLLNETGSRRYHQDMIRQAQSETFVRDVAPVHGKDKTISRVRAMLVTFVNLIAR